MQHRGREPAILAPCSDAHQANDDIGIFAAPAAEGCIEAVDLIEIAATDRQIGAARAPPGAAADTTQRPKRQAHKRQQAIDLATQPRRYPRPERPALRLDAIAQDPG